MLSDSGIPFLMETRKADRAKMVQLLTALVTTHGFALDSSAMSICPDETHVDIACARGLHVMFDLSRRSGQAHPNTFVVSWYMHRRDCGDARLSESVFGFDSVNKCHGQKATQVFYGFPDLYDGLAKAFQAVADGAAFVEPKLTD